MSTNPILANLLDEAKLKPYLEIFEEQFGIAASTFADYLVYRANNQALWIFRRELELPPTPTPFTLGMPFFYHRMRFPRPTTAAVLRWGHLATRNLADLDQHQMRELIGYREVLVDPAQLIEWRRGYTLLRFRDRVLGIALGLLDPDNRPQLRSLTPKYWRLRYDRNLKDEAAELT